MTWQPGPSKIEFPEIFEQDHVCLSQKNLKPCSWQLDSPVGIRLLERIRKCGTPLGEYCKGRFYRGVLTGFNEAFVVNRATRDRLIEEHPSSDAVLKPFLRGRDVKRWRCEPQDLWLIFTRRGIDIKAFPAVHAYLKPYQQRLTPGVPGGRKPGSYEWYEIQDNIAYWQEFNQPKIVYPDIYEHQTFAFDTEGYFFGNTCYFVPTDEKWFLSFLNSSLMEWFYGSISNRIRGGYLRAFSQYVGQIPIPTATEDQKQLCENLSSALIFLHRSEAASLPTRGLMVSYFEQWLNGLVYELFFPGELHARNLYIFDVTASVGFPADPSAPHYAGELQLAFECAHDLNKPLRAMLADLQTIEEVRIIEGGK